MSNTEKISLPEKLKNRLYPAVLELFSDNDFHQVNMREIYNIWQRATGAP
ncbi:MAG TPA: hypothetical protein PLQ82_10810 [Desulfobacteraceae bacterium]|nr:hypothetical protein [Desulfobacteraceae bacterium]